MTRRQKDKLKAKEASILGHAEKCSECLEGYICKVGERALDSFERARTKYLEDDRAKAERRKVRET